MVSASLFRELHHAYFTVTAQQSTIDQWRMHGGHTTFMARGSKANKDSVRLAPFVGVIDGTTGRPANRRPSIATGKCQELSTIGDLVEGVSSHWRLPVLIFCGKDDEGMSLEDEEYLGRPLEHGEACVVLSEAWVLDSVAAGRLLRMADYAKHASPGIDVDLPSLFLPTPFPPTYRIALSHLQDTSANLLFTPHEEDLGGTGVKQDHIREGPVLQVLVSDGLVATALPLRNVRPPGYIGTNKHDRLQDGRLVVADSGRALIAFDQSMSPKTPERIQKGTPRNVSSRKPHLLSFQTDGLIHGATEAYSAYNRFKSPPSLESYIYAKKQSHIERIEQDLATWNIQNMDQTDIMEEGRVEMELDEEGESMTGGMEVKIAEQNNGATGSYTGETAAGPDSANKPLELEADMLLKLLPHLKLSGLPDTEAEPDDNHLRFNHAKDSTSFIPYYPYLTATSYDVNAKAIPPSSSDQAPPLPSNLQDSRHRAHPPACHKTTPEPVSQKTVIAFHSAGYGVGWMDFEACADWVCVLKQKRSG